MRLLRSRFERFGRHVATKVRGEGVTEVKREPQTLATASTDVYLVCDMNLVVTMDKDDIFGFKDYAKRLTATGNVYECLIT